MIRGTPRWKIELLASSPPLPELWVTLRHENGREYKFVDRSEADAALVKLLTHQAHMKALIRIVAM